MIQEHRYVVVGAGPAGLQIGYFLQERGADYLVVERKHPPETSSAGSPGTAG